MRPEKVIIYRRKFFKILCHSVDFFVGNVIFGENYRVL